MSFAADVAVAVVVFVAAWLLSTLSVDVEKEEECCGGEKSFVKGVIWLVHECFLWAGFGCACEPSEEDGNTCGITG